MILGTRYLPHRVKYIFHQHGAWLGGCEWMLLSILNLEHVGDTVLLPSQGQEAFSWAWPGPPDLEFRSCASDSDWRFRYMTSKRQRESPKFVATTDEGNCRIGHTFLYRHGMSHKGKWVHVSREFHNLFTIQRHTGWKHKEQQQVTWKQ